MIGACALHEGYRRTLGNLIFIAFAQQQWLRLMRINTVRVSTFIVLLTFYGHRYWEDSIKMGIQEVEWGGMNWIDVARTGGRGWRRF
jgi:hypothetical protein